MKKCNRCFEEKDESEFTPLKHKAGAYVCQCKKCRQKIAVERKSEYVSVERLKEIFYYRNDGSLIRKVATSKVKVGDVAGSLSSSGHLKVSVDNKRMFVHGIIFALHYGFIPKMIDHLDGNPANNKIENLAESTHALNSKNQKLRSNNTSGQMGVCWSEKRKKWCASIRGGGKLIHIGRFSDKDAAIKARKDAENVYGYSKNHGRIV